MANVRIENHVVTRPQVSRQSCTAEKHDREPIHALERLAESHPLARSEGQVVESTSVEVASPAPGATSLAEAPATTAIDAIEQRIKAYEHAPLRPVVDAPMQPPYIDADGDICEVCRVTEARVELKKSHAFLATSAVIQSLGEYFTHTHFAEEDGEWLFDEYTNDSFVVTYCLNSCGRDQLWVRWVDPDAEDAHTEYELPDMARQLARLLGGGINLRLVDRMVQCKRLRVPELECA